MLVTRILLGSYFAISRGVLADTVPKAVIPFLVNSVQRGPAASHSVPLPPQPGTQLAD